MATLGLSGLFYGERKRLHNEVRQQFLAGGFHLLACFGLGVGFQCHGHMTANTNIVDAGQVEVLHVIDYRFTLWVQQFTVGHNVNFGDKLHCVVDLWMGGMVIGDWQMW